MCIWSWEVEVGEDGNESLEEGAGGPSQSKLEQIGSTRCVKVYF